MPDYYGFEYFCGANVTIQVEDFPILEAAGISYQISEGKRPLYGYSSRHFDAVARGQVLVQGSLLINYVHNDYLFRAIDLGARKALEYGDDIDDKLTVPEAGSPEYDRWQALLAGDFDSNPELADAFRERYWQNNQNTNTGNYGTTWNPHDNFSSVNLKIVFGEQDDVTMRYGKTGVLLTAVEFTGRGKSIQIDEQVIVEEYTFLARDEITLYNDQVAVSTTTSGPGGVETTSAILNSNDPMINGATATQGVPTIEYMPPPTSR